MQRTAGITLAIIILGLLGGCASVSAPLFIGTAPSACPAFEDSGAVECFAISVPENRNGVGATIDLEALVLKSRSESPAAPLFVLPGGPGQSATRAAGPRKYFADVFDELRNERDIVLIAPRGTAGSNELSLALEAATYFSSLETVVAPEWARSGRAALEARADLTQYTTSAIVEDLEATRQALGYDTINIYGTSYGTRVAQLYGVRYADHVTSMILKAPVPPSEPIPLTYTPGSDRALRIYFTRCAGDVACTARYPEIEQRFERLLSRLDASPVEIEVENPMSGEKETVAIDRGVFGAVLRALMMNAYAGPMTLKIIDQADAGDYSTVAALLLQIRAAYVEQLATGMAMSVIATEDLPRISAGDLEVDAGSGFLRGAVARSLVAAGADWPVAAPAADNYDFMTGNTLVLIVTGALDPATPPAFGAMIAERLSNARIVTFAGGAHSAANFTGLAGIMTEFVRRGDPTSLDLSAAEENQLVPLLQ